MTRRHARGDVGFHVDRQGAGGGVQSRLGRSVDQHDVGTGDGAEPGAG